MAPQKIIDSKPIVDITSGAVDVDVKGFQIPEGVNLITKRFGGPSFAKPIIANRRPPSKLNEIQPDHWLAEYTSDLIDLLNVLGLLIELEPQQDDLLERICSGGLLSREALEDANALELPPKRRRKKAAKGQKSLLDDVD